MKGLKYHIDKIWNGDESSKHDVLMQTKSDDVVQRVMYVGGRPWIWTIPKDELVNHTVDQKDVNVAICLRVMKDKISSLPWRLKRRVDDADGNIGYEYIDEHPVLESLRNPNAWIDESELKKHIVQSYLLCGKNHIWIVRGMIDELWAQPSWRIRTVYDKQTEMPKGFEKIGLDGKKTYYDYEEMIHIKNYDMRDPFEGGNPLSAPKESILANRYATKFNEKFFKNGANYSILFTQDGVMGLDPDEGKELIESYNDEHGGLDNAFKQGLLPKGIKPFNTQPTIKDMTFEILVKLNRESILGFFGVPPTEAGVMQFASYANALSEKRSFWENTLIPLKSTIERGMTRQYLWMKTKDRKLELELSTDDIDALKNDRKTEMETASIGYQGGFVTLNESRAMVDLPAIDDGDETKQPAPMPMMPMPDDDDDDKPEPPDDGKKAIEFRTFQRKAMDNYIVSYELKYEKVLKSYMKKQRDRIMKNIDDVLGKSFTAGIYKAKLFKQASLMHHEYDQLMEMKDDNPIPPVNPNELFQLSLENDEWQKIGEPFISDTVDASGKRVGALIGTPFGFNVTNPEVEEMITRLTNRSKHFNTTTFKKIKEMMNDAYDEGLGSAGLKKNIRDQYQRWLHPDELTQSRAMTIARTEMTAVVNGGSNQGMKQAYKQGYIEGKEWLTTFDGDTRDEHAHADGQIVLPDSKFEVGGDALDYPGDPNGRAGNIINCRCTALPVKKVKW